MKQNIGELLRDRAALTPDAVAAVAGQYRYSYRQQNARVNQFAAWLVDQGMAEGDCIALLCKNSEQMVSAMLGAGKAGLTSALLNWRLQAPELSYILNDCKARVLVYDREFEVVVDLLRSEIPATLFVAVDRSGQDDEFDALLAAMPDQEPEINLGGDDTALLMYTSGTTGRPKGAMLSHANLYWAAYGLTFTVGWPHRSRYLAVTPMFHIAGMVPILVNIYGGCATHYEPDFHPLDIWERIEHENINSFLAVPQMLEMMLQVPGVAQRDLSGLQYIISGASAVPRELSQAYADLGIEVRQVYGATEMCGACSFWLPELGMDRITSVGRPVMHAQVKIVDPNNLNELPTGEVGEVWFASPQVFKGYLNLPEASREVLVDGYYRSGDLGWVDEDGILTIVDRLKDLIISGGENIYPAEVEAVLLQHPDVDEVAVIGQPDPKWHEVPVAYVVRRAESELEADALIELCRQSLARYKCIRGVEFVEQLPRNASGKLLKRMLRPASA